MAPPDYQQGDGFRIIYVHAPAAWLSLWCTWSWPSSAAVGLIWRMNVAHAVAASCATIGASFTALALATGMLWGRPMWGTYWEWDPRLTSELLLLFLYLGYMGLRNAIDDAARADRASAVLAIVGVVNVPIIHYSVIWWNSLHQAPDRHEIRRADHAGLDAGSAAADAGRLHLLFRGAAADACARRSAAARAQCALDRRGGWRGTSRGW